jgi:ribonuclease Z
MIKIQFLGTCAGIPSKERNVSSLVIQMLQYENECWMIDCGEGTQHQLLHSSLTLSKINKIFITHLHGDHIFGLPGVLGSRSFQGATEKLQLFGPKGIKEFIETALMISNTYIRYPLEIIEIVEGTILRTDSFTFEAISLDHGIPSYGFRITEKDTAGKLDIEKTKEFGISPGPILKKIKARESIVLDTGIEVNGAESLGPDKKGKVIAIGGDTRKTDNQNLLAKNADILIHEATFLHKDERLAYEHFHSTANEVATLAKNNGVKVLFLNHISSRYSHGIEELLFDAQSVFPNTFIPNDLQMFLIKQNDDVILL